MSTWNRVAERQQIVDIVNAAAADSDESDPLFGLVATYGDPDFNEAGVPDFVFVVGDIRGDSQTSAMGLGMRTWSDSYTVETGLLVQTSDTPKAADVKCWAAVLAIFDLLFVSPHLDRNPHPIDDVFVNPARLEGPNSSGTNGSASTSLALIDISISRGVRGT